jgi:hypothetical protein
MIMKKLKKIAGLIWAFLALVLIIVFFPGLSGFSKSLARLPFMKINPNFTGGEVSFSKISPVCTLVVHKPVFDGLIKEGKEGFVQVDWRGRLPGYLSDTIDYDRDSKPDFIVNIDTHSKDTKFTPVDKLVKNLNISTPVSYGWTIRVNLRHY